MDGELVAQVGNELGHRHLAARPGDHGTGVTVQSLGNGGTQGGFLHLEMPAAGDRLPAGGGRSGTMPPASDRHLGGGHPSRVPEDLQVARTCYDHLAGAVAVRWADALVDGGLLVEESGRYTVTESGTARFRDFGLDLEALRRARRAFAQPCLDWSERRDHVAGAVGSALLARMVDSGGSAAQPASRAVHLHPAAREGMARVFGC